MQRRHARDVFLNDKLHDESSGVRHVRRMFHPGRGLGGPRARRSNMHFTSSTTGGLSTSQSSSQSSNYSREAMDPIAGQSHTEMRGRGYMISSFRKCRLSLKRRSCEAWCRSHRKKMLLVQSGGKWLFSCYCNNQYHSAATAGGLAHKTLLYSIYSGTWQLKTILTAVLIEIISHTYG